ncbi:MAG: hypothetical protein IPM82_19955 [Saprospiraceae bacterium]|nr:hypothetical protein [Saprospiraceae bacterium]
MEKLPKGKKYKVIITFWKNSPKRKKFAISQANPMRSASGKNGRRHLSGFSSIK